MTINEVTLNNNKLNTEQLEKVAGGIGGSNCPRCGSTHIRPGSGSSTCSECSANWRTLYGGRILYNNTGKVSCPSCGSRKLEFLFRSTSTVKYLCPKCQHQFALQGGQYC